MKIKNIIILGGIVFAIYYLSKKKSSTITATVTPEVEGGHSMPDDADKDLTDVSNGEEPQSLSADEKLKLFNRATKSYTGGARPSRLMLMNIEKDKIKAILEINEKGLAEEFKEWKQKFGQKKKSKFPAPIGKPKKISRPRPVGDVVQIRRDKMPLPRMKTYAIDTTSSLGLTNMPPMAV